VASPVRIPGWYPRRVKPWIELARAEAPGGGVLSLHRRDDELVIRVDGQELMSSRRHGSEDRLAELGLAGLDAADVLIGGLGLGFTLRAALAHVAAAGRVVVVELAAAVVAWNQGLLGPEAAAAIADPRVTIEVGDVADALRAPGRFDAILLDVDNSPHALSHPGNRGLYTIDGLVAARRALRPGGRLAVWSASRHPEFERRLARAGFAVEVHAARAHRARGATHTIYLGRT
jgi:spermidine synthase